MPPRPFKNLYVAHSVMRVYNPTSMKNTGSVHLCSKIMTLTSRIQELKTESLDSEITEKIDIIQGLLADLYLSTEQKVKKIASDYAFLSRDHVFFDGDNNHSGAV